MTSELKKTGLNIALRLSSEQSDKQREYQATLAEESDDRLWLSGYQSGLDYAIKVIGAECGLIKETSQ